ncbi:MAG: thioredoxin family protein [Thaumarchaeota archaeon]|nr:thioredoxin family protein [Nitrososphaerota archaeon]
MPHTIQVFSGGCELCKAAAEIVEAGKCKDCKMEVLSVEDGKTKSLMKRYSIGAVPSIVIDGKIKVVGIPTFPWFCGDEFYRMLGNRYSLRQKSG